MVREWRVRESGTTTSIGLLGSSDSGFEERINELQKDTGLSRLTLRVCLLRGLESDSAIREFLSPKLESLTDPFCVKDMEAAVARLVQVRERGERFRVFGDYDVDGTTGAALLSWVFKDFGYATDRLSVRQPDRFKDGYGLNAQAVTDAHADGVQLLITVDCGITSFDASERARELGVELIVIDHHQVDPVKGIPYAVAVVNPQRTDCPSQLRQLCGCGLAFYVARALRTRGKALGWWEPGREPNLKQHLDLVVMATAADMVPLIGDNHILVRHGLEILKFTRKPGIRALLEAAGLTQREISPSHLGFAIGPRINASGRMASATLALELLTTSDPVAGSAMAKQLEALNKERAEIQNAIWDQVRGRVEKGIADGKHQHGVVVADPGWHEGVVGIVASRVTETFQRPAAVIALREDFGKGSVRSYAGKDVLAALRACAPHLLGFGGHKHAAGLSVALDGVEAFAEAFDQALGQLTEDAHARPLYIEGTCSVDDLNVRTVQELEYLGPFGPGNPEPVFALKAAVKNQRVLKGRHLKLNLSPVGADPASIEAIWFNGAEREDATPGALSSEAEWAGVPELNRYNGRVTPTLRVKDFRKPL